MLWGVVGLDASHGAGCNRQRIGVRVKPGFWLDLDASHKAGRSQKRWGPQKGRERASAAGPDSAMQPMCSATGT